MSKTASNPDRAAKGTAHPAGFSIAPLYTWVIDDIPYNFNSTGDHGVAGKIFSQLYFRQAVQMLVNQPGEIRQDLKGFGVLHHRPRALEPLQTRACATDVPAVASER